MPILAAAGAVSGFIGMLGSFLGGGAKKDAAYAAAQMQDQQAANQEEVNREQLRRKDIENAFQLGDVTSKANASGFQGTTGSVRDQFQPTSTTQLYLKQFAAEQAQEREFAQHEGQITVENMRQEAALRRQAADAGMFGDVLSGINSGVQGIASLGKGLNLFGMGGNG